MLDVAIVDDEKDVREELAQMVLRFASQEGIRAKTHAYVDGADLLAALDAGEAVHDIVLLDIEMAQVSGMDAAHELRRRGCDAQIVFVTNMAQYAIRGYEVGAFDFVVKPVEYPVFAFKFKRVVEAARARRRDRVVSVWAWRRGGLAFLCVENSCVGTAELGEGGFPATSKDDPDYHGFGLRSIRDVATRHGGNVTLDAEDGRFSLTVLLPLAGEWGGSARTCGSPYLTGTI